LNILLFGKFPPLFLAIFISLALHIMLAYFIFNNWEVEKKIQKVTSPKYLQAKLVNLEEKIQKKIQTKPKPKPKLKPKSKAKRIREEKKKKEITDIQKIKNFQKNKQPELEDGNKKIISSYSAYITERIEANWNRPPSARREMEVKLLIKLVPTGQVISVQLIETSGNEAFDRSAVQAVYKVGHFDRLRELDIQNFEKTFRQFQLVFKPDDLRL
jgi:colicin import membrane protein